MNLCWWHPLCNPSARTPNSTATARTRRPISQRIAGPPIRPHSRPQKRHYRAPEIAMEQRPTTLAAASCKWGKWTGAVPRTQLTCHKEHGHGTRGTRQAKVESELASLRLNVVSEDTDTAAVRPSVFTSSSAANYRFQVCTKIPTK
ncbi:uncharacterized protein LOC108148294 [Drosophila elegans]|uniref:uncharacterized protein LOC108148294 n=1 Tax=Drosophila elegans TaxID=30023 RepID=UPI0007E8AE11|nr:uncharacterized protein LOC108148294 [Drosophila elegans]